MKRTASILSALIISFTVAGAANAARQGVNKPSVYKPSMTSRARAVKEDPFVLEAKAGVNKTAVRKASITARPRAIKEDPFVLEAKQVVN